MEYSGLSRREFLTGILALPLSLMSPSVAAAAQEPVLTYDIWKQGFEAYKKAANAEGEEKKALTQELKKSTLLARVNSIYKDPRRAFYTFSNEDKRGINKVYYDQKESVDIRNQLKNPHDIGDAVNTILLSPFLPAFDAASEILSNDKYFEDFYGRKISSNSKRYYNLQECIVLYFDTKYKNQIYDENVKLRKEEEAKKTPEQRQKEKEEWDKKSNVERILELLLK
ncbi:MAG: hypothetical protein Q8N99_06925 [Nanoarchaeota archaeon]|nr:hypothetical protein [Nanoarchaeota archaeon]